jgi:uncharacterized protein YoxC
MIYEIIAGVAAVAFVILVIFLVLTLRDTRRTLKKADRILSDVHKALDAVAEPAEHLVQSLNKLTLDLKKKSEGLDVLFRPLYGMREGKEEHDGLCNIVECVGGAIRLFKKIKKEVTR